MPAYIDTSIVLAAMAKSWPQTASCQQLLRAIGRGEQDATTSAETLRELLSVLLDHGEEHAALVAAPALERLLGPLPQVTAADALAASELLGKCPGLTPRLAVHLCAATRLGCSVLFTLDEVPPLALPIRCVSPSPSSTEWEPRTP